MKESIRAKLSVIAVIGLLILALWFEGAFANEDLRLGLILHTFHADESDNDNTYGVYIKPDNFIIGAYRNSEDENAFLFGHEWTVIKNLNFMIGFGTNYETDSNLQIVGGLSYQFGIVKTVFSHKAVILGLETGNLRQ